MRKGVLNINYYVQKKEFKAVKALQVQGLTIKEIAKATGRSYQTTRLLVHAHNWEDYKQDVNKLNSKNKHQNFIQRIWKGVKKWLRIGKK
jgi:transposase